MKANNGHLSANERNLVELATQVHKLKTALEFYQFLIVGLLTELGDEFTISDDDARKLVPSFAIRHNADKSITISLPEVTRGQEEAAKEEGQAEPLLNPPEI